MSVTLKYLFVCFFQRKIEEENERKKKAQEEKVSAVFLSMQTCQGLVVYFCFSVEVQWPRG